MKSNTSRTSAWVYVCLAVALLWASAAQGQTFRGTILGTVTDSSGAAIAGATVTVKNTGTGLTRTVTTSDDGSYAVPELPIGKYAVSVERSGFKTAVVNDVAVEVASERRADVMLQPGEVAQRVEVSASELPQVESTNNVLGGIVESKIVNTLPVNGRDYQKLILLVPGVAASPDQISDSPGSYGTISVNGARGRSNNYLLDGTDMNDGYRNDPAINEAGVFGTPATILPVEAIAEMRVASNFEAEYGRSAGAVINVVTKSGANTFHGSAFEFLRNTVLNARNYFNTAPDPQQPFHDNQFGGSLGGPIVKDKTFFFGDYEGVRETGSQSSRACVPTAQNITANTPAGGINPVIQKLLSAGKAWPAPTDASAADCYTNGGTNTTLSTPFSNRVDSAIAKIDHSFNANNLLTGRYYFGDSDQSFPLALSGGGLVKGYNTATPTRVQLVSISFVSTISPSIVNEARLGWNRFAEGFFAEDRNFDPSSIGLNTVGTGTPNKGNPYNFGLPVITIGDASFPQLGADKADPRQRVDTNWHYIDNVSWKAGRHDVKFGYEFRRTSISQIFNRNFRGRLKFDTLGDFLAGIPSGSSGSSNSQNTGNSNRNTFENSYAGYLQDSIRLGRKFTLNLGIRYDYFGIVQEKHGLFNNVDPTFFGQTFPVGNGRLYQPDYNNWAPRVSVAWDVTGKAKTVLRAGYGIFYDAFSQDMFLGHLPFTTSFAPGPAYSGLSGPGQITTANPSGATIASGVPVYGFFSPIIDSFGVDPKIRSPYIQNYNLNFQQDLGHQMVFQIGYVGSNGHKLFDFRDINQPTAATIHAYDYATNGCCVPGALNFSTFRNVIYWEESAANSAYNSLQVSWKINGWHGLTSGLSYAWSHSIDTASDGEDYVPNAAQPTDSMTSLKSNRGNSNFDVRNRLTWNFIYEFPNHKGSWAKLTDGWGLNGVLTVQSGQPFHFILLTDDYDGSGTFFPKPDVVGAIKYNRSDPSQFLDLSAFAVPCKLDGTDIFAQNCVFNAATGNSMHFGNEGRNSLLGPTFRQFDFSIFKNTNLTERLKMELRIEAYNLFNHPNFASPLYPGFLANADFNGIGLNGRTTGFYPLTVTGDVGIGYPFLGGGGPRSMQVAVHFTF